MAYLISRYCKTYIWVLAVAVGGLTFHSRKLQSVACINFGIIGSINPGHGSNEFLELALSVWKCKGWPKEKINILCKQQTRVANKLEKTSSML